MKRIVLTLAFSSTFAITVGCLPSPGATGDAGATGGAKATGSGGANTTGSGGANTTGSGGTNTTGSGGANATGSGGDGSGGSESGSGTGGRGGSGGTASGGSGTATGGRGGSGGANATGSGGTGTGGRGGGGTGTGGMGTGGANSGGAGPTPCNLPNHSGSGSFTHYYFGQGTGRDGSGYRTACGYYGTEGGSTASGPTDTVTNIASMSPASATYFAAIPGNNGFDSKGQCGACVQITGQNGRMIIATVVDECPFGTDGGNPVCGANPQGHLDLSNAAFDQLGYSVGDPKNTNWKFVPCPVTGNVVLQIKNGNDNEFFIQNTILAIKSVQRAGVNAVHQKYGAWHFDSAVIVGDTLNLTDAANRTLDIQVMSTAMGQNQNTGKQFQACQ
jgi:hypothetical protein